MSEHNIKWAKTEWASAHPRQRKRNSTEISLFLTENEKLEWNKRKYWLVHDKSDSVWILCGFSCWTIVKVQTQANITKLQPNQNTVSLHSSCIFVHQFTKHKLIRCINVFFEHLDHPSSIIQFQRWSFAEFLLFCFSSFFQSRYYFRFVLLCWSLTCTSLKWYRDRCPIVYVFFSIFFHSITRWTGLIFFLCCFIFGLTHVRSFNLCSPFCYLLKLIETRKKFALNSCNDNDIRWFFRFTHLMDLTHSHKLPMFIFTWLPKKMSKRFANEFSNQLLQQFSTEKLCYITWYLMKMLPSTIVTYFQMYVLT